MYGNFRDFCYFQLIKKLQLPDFIVAYNICTFHKSKLFSVRLMLQLRRKPTFLNIPACFDRACRFPSTKVNRSNTRSLLFFFSYGLNDLDFTWSFERCRDVRAHSEDFIVRSQAHRQRPTAFRSPVVLLVHRYETGTAVCRGGNL